MTRFAVSPVEAIEHMPSGSTLLVPEVSWEEYEELLSALGEGYGVRIVYDRGTLSIMSPSAKHEKLKEFILRLADTLADELGWDLESFGSTTFKRSDLQRGAEPDTCFYVQNAARVNGKDQLDLSIDPAPDVIVEIDVAHTSTGKLEFYGQLGVPEIWLYDGEEVRILHQTSDGYAAAQTSRAFPFLSTVDLNRFIRASQSAPQRQVLRSVREWVRSERRAR